MKNLSISISITMIVCFAVYLFLFLENPSVFANTEAEPNKEVKHAVLSTVMFLGSILFFFIHSIELLEKENEELKSKLDSLQFKYTRRKEVLN